MAPTTTTTANNAQVTTTSASNAGLVVPHSSNSQLQPHHLANLLCQAALQLSGNLSHVLPQLQLPTEALVPPATTVTATAQVTTSNQPHPPQQEDQLSEASALIPTIPSPVTPLPTTITRNPPPLDTTLDPTSSLSPQSNEFHVTQTPTMHYQENQFICTMDGSVECGRIYTTLSQP